MAIRCRVLTTFMNWLAKFAADNPKSWHFTKALTSVIPGFMLVYVAIKWTNRPLPFQDTLRAFFDDHIKTTLACIVTPLALPHLFSYVDRGVAKFRDQDTKSKFISAALINALNNVVGTKLRRFAEYLKKMDSNQTKGDTFLAITQPEQQFTTILDGFHHLVRDTTSDDTIQIVFARISEKQIPIEYVVRIPHDIQLPISLLGPDAHKSMFHHCARQNKSIVIPNIESHLRKPLRKRLYHPTGNPDVDRGSIICWPLFCECTGKVEFILSIKSNNANVIAEGFKKLYKTPIESVVTRLLMEHHLSLIKKKAI